MQVFTGKQYLQIDIANCFGHDKWTWIDRIAWVHTNEHDLELLTEKADNKPQYRKAVHAYRNLDQASGHIMFLDCTASGLQIMAALTGDHKTARAVNLINTGKREDVYQTFAEGMNQSLVVKDQVQKALIKKPLMTHFYNKGSHSDVLNPNQEEAFYETLEGLFPGAEDYMSILNRRWNPNSKFHAFRLPDGHVAYMPVTEMQDLPLKFKEYGVEVPFRHEVTTESTRSSSLVPNVTHGVDGYIVREMERMADDQGFEILPIHDAFGFHPNYGNQVRQNFIDIMASLAESDLLSSIASDLQGEKVTLRKYSDNLADEIRNSEYMLS